MDDAFLGRFWVKVEKSGPCWEWTSSKNWKGYGVIKTPAHKYLKMAHRVSWEIANGEIPDGLLVCHKCDNPGCVNPNHLFLGTPKQNTTDMLSKNRQRKSFTNLTEEEKQKANKLLNSGMKLREAMEKYGLSQSDAFRLRHLHKKKSPQHRTNPNQ